MGCDVIAYCLEIYSRSNIKMIIIIVTIIAAKYLEVTRDLLCIITKIIVLRIYIGGEAIITNYFRDLCMI